ncbi:lysine-2,3-aminomutase-like protein [Allorhizobium terrae]|uniref:Lysine-2,3-aminomutase-like protein n=1 Tax=Allorhizobium terrae TaxID=1848972 RepID=A0A4S3ZNJ2_9HYPH|nr:lysine-2,3-aminomutase-like protein [Allorhizobium terrae]THF47019.1 lysine-2,3-aminomutase-like protein [Allorhizobium terrae]
MTLKTVGELLDAGLVKSEDAEGLIKVSERYAIAITPAMQALMDVTDTNDPIAAQFIPSAQELIQTPQELADPIGDHAHSPVEGIVHRYPDRVLLKAVHSCPVYCRFCFRREMVGPDGDGLLTGDALEKAIDYIRSHRDIWEVIFTGGDPLVLSPRRLKAILEQLASIEHVKIIRFHTRVPVVDPARIDDALLEALKASGKTTYIAIHANHARELTEVAKVAVDRLLQNGFALVSQTVLLKGVNDDPAVLAELMRKFVELRIRPYYLHHPDLAPGTGHFRLSLKRGQEIVAALRGHVSGLCQPTYVLDIPGGHGKVPIGANAVIDHGDGYQMTDFRGVDHPYQDR